MQIRRQRDFLRLERLKSYAGIVHDSDTDSDTHTVARSAAVESFMVELYSYGLATCVAYIV